MRTTFFIPLAILLMTSVVSAAEFDHTHSAFTEVLQLRVKDGRVDYASIKSNPAALNSYLNLLGAVKRSEFKSWNENQQLSFLINLYNAATLDLIRTHYPVESIKDIGTLFKGPWKQEVVKLWKKVRTLDELEHEIIRVDYPKVPEVHFALVCAAIGCPPLRSEAYEADRLQEQLAEQRKTFLSDSKKNRVDQKRKRLYISPIFKWFPEDFERVSGSVPNYLKQSEWPDIETTYRIRYTDYDWSLNTQ